METDCTLPSPPTLVIRTRLKQEWPLMVKWIPPLLWQGALPSQNQKRNEHQTLRLTDLFAEIFRSMTTIWIMHQARNIQAEENTTTCLQGCQEPFQQLNACMSTKTKQTASSWDTQSFYLVSSTFCTLQAQCLRCIGLSAGKQAAPYQSAAVEGCTSLHCHWPGLGSADRSWLQSQWQKDFRKRKSRCHNTLLRSKLRRRARHCTVRSSMPPSSPRIQN